MRDDIFTSESQFAISMCACGCVPARILPPYMYTVGDTQEYVLLHVHS